MAVPTYGKGGQGKEPMGGPYSARRTEPSPSIEWAAHYPVPPRSVRLVQTRFPVSNSVEQTPVEKVEQAPAYSRPALTSAEGPIREVWWCRNSDRTHPASQDPLSRTAATLNSPASGRVFFEPMLVQRSPRTVAQAGGAPDRFATKTAEVTRPRLQVGRHCIPAPNPPPHVRFDANAFSDACCCTGMVAAHPFKGA